MNTNKKRNRIILCICSILVLFASVFAFIPLNKETKVVKADSVTSDYSFSGSNISSKTTFTNGEFSYNLLDNYITNYSALGMTWDFVDGYLHVYGTCTSDFTLSNRLPLNIAQSDYYTFSSYGLTGIHNYGIWIYDTNNNLVATFNNDNGFTHYLDSGSYTVSYFLNSFTVGTYYDFYFNFQLNQGTVPLPYQPYQDSTYLNYEFDFSSIYDFDYEWTRIDTKFNINSNLDFARVSNNNYQSIQGDGKSYSFTTNTKGAVTQLTFSAINKETNVLDNNYIFRIYTFLDYIDNENYNPATFFTANIGFIVLGSYKDYSTYFRNDYSLNTTFLTSGKYNFISYVDNNNNNLNFLIPLDSDNDSDYWQFRTYYTSNASVDTSGAYSNGYNQGYNTGYGVGEQVGYDDGYNSGKNDGYNLGYNTALANEKYSFTNLISAVIDVPVKTFTSLFNFEILGVNLSGFFLGLLTCCIVIGVVRLIL